MDCCEARDHLSELARGRLDAGTEAAVRAHVGQCPPCAEALRVQEKVRALVRGQAPRYAAPQALQARLRSLLGQAPPRRSGWRDRLGRHPWMVGSLAGAVAVLLLAGGGLLWLVRDPVSPLLARAVAEHVEYVRATMDRPAADPEGVVRALKGQVAFPLGPVFPGDDQVQLVAGMLSDLGGRQAATFIYRDSSGRYVTLFLMPEAGIPIPEKGRMPIQTFKPYHREEAGRHLLLWKQRDLACLIVSDLDQAATASMFLKIRRAA